MTYFRVNGEFPDHLKVRKLGDDKLVALGVWTLCGSWAAGRSPDDGFVPAEIVQRFDRKERYAQRLVDVGLWVEDEQFAERGYRFHQWRRHQRDWRPKIPEALRERVYLRDCYRCQHCGTQELLSLDHIYPRALGGKDTFENLQILCVPCNSRKGARV